MVQGQGYSAEGTVGEFKFIVMRYIVTIIFAFISSSLFAQNQEVVQSQALQQQDTVTVAQPMAPLADSSLVGTSIFQLLGRNAGGKVTVNQPQEFEQAYRTYLGSNKERKRNGYRIRLFFDNKQTARVESEELEKAFKEQFPQIPTYRSYTNPFFKVVVGDYRTKSDAIRELKNILPYYPKAIVVKESIYFPAI